MIAGPRKAPGRFGLTAATEQTAGMAFLMILLDVSANLLCVVVLLLTVSATAQSPRHPPAEAGFPVIAGQVLAPAGLVEAFRVRTVRDDSVSTIDLRREHIEVKIAGASPSALFHLSLDDPDFVHLVRRKLAPATGRILVFVFSQDGHAALRRSLDGVAAPVMEIDVPAALRAGGPDGGWSERFRVLFGRDIEPWTFRGLLARIIAGDVGANEAQRAPARQSGEAGGPGTPVWTAIQIGWRLFLLLLSVYAVARVGRMQPLAP